MNYLLIFALLWLSLTTGFKQPASSAITGYNLSKPDKRWSLPEELKEISGITATDENTVACVQDEKGTVFFYDISNSSIKRDFVFNGDGDYEDLVKVNNEMFILRSDGTLFKLTSFSDKPSKANTIETDIPSEDSEGLCYDSDGKKLLIACKADIKSDKYKNKRAVFAFDIKSGTLSAKPFLVIDPKAIKRFISDNKIHVKIKKEHKHDDDDDFKVDFRMSAIGIHPVTKKIFIISAADYLICVYNRDGKLENIEFLDSKLFNKAEGITFLPNGDLLVSNEGENGSPTLLRFNYLRNR